MTPEQRDQAIRDLEMIFDGPADRARRHAIAAVESVAFARLLAEAERRGAEKALRDAAYAWDGSDDPKNDPSDPVTAFLYDRADAIARGES